MQVNDLNYDHRKQPVYTQSQQEEAIRKAKIELLDEVMPELYKLLGGETIVAASVSFHVLTILINQLKDQIK